MIAATLSFVSILLIALTPAGVLGGVISLIKLRPDINSSTVTQATTTMEAMQKFTDQLRADRDYWELRARKAEDEQAGLLIKIHALEQSAGAS